MKSEYVFPTVLIELYVAESVPYAAKCNWSMMVYWLAAAHSFPNDYVLTGNRCEQVKQIGNSVPVMTAAAMCEADFSEVADG